MFSTTPSSKHVAYTQLSGKKNNIIMIMEKYNNNLLEIDVDKLFEENHIEDILVIKKMYDAEIERKRIELRSMVSEKYKDILAASDAITTMKDMSQRISDDVNCIQSRMEVLLDVTQTGYVEEDLQIDERTLEERKIIMQINLTITLNEQIWMCLDEEDYLKAAQFYLLAQHVHTGLRLLKKDILEKVPYLIRIKGCLEMLRTRILNGVRQKLETLDMDAETTSSNLSTLMLLESQSCSELLITFIGLRKNALKTLMVQSHSSVRHQLSAMVKCLITTIHLLNDCFIRCGNVENGLIWKQLEEIVDEDAPPTLSKIMLPLTPLLVYISDIIRQFRPKCNYSMGKEWRNDLDDAVKDWLHFTSETVSRGLGDALELITSIKGLQIIREEALKIATPDNWETICQQTNLPKNFNVWYYFFQDLITRRAVALLTKKVSDNVSWLQAGIVEVLRDVSDSKNFDIVSYIWTEDRNDVSKIENIHNGLSMKTKGYSPDIIELCEGFDSMFSNILSDSSHYLYGKERDDTASFHLRDKRHETKFADKRKLLDHLTSESVEYSKGFVEFLKGHVRSTEENFVPKCLTCARILQALTTLCDNYKRCASCNDKNEWDGVVDFLLRSSNEFWMNWVDDVTKRTELVSGRLTGEMDVPQMAKIYHKWDGIEIQEETDEKVFKSQIRVPYQLSVPLLEVLNHLSESLGRVLPHTLPKQVHSSFIERNVTVIFARYDDLTVVELTQKQALQYLFDVKFLTVFSVQRENVSLLQKSQKICDKLRGKIDPFDLDVFYSYVQHNVKQLALQSQVIFGCLLPNSGQLANLGMIEKSKEQEKEPSILPVSVPSTLSWFSLLPITAPTQKNSTQQKEKESPNKINKPTKKNIDATSSIKSGASALFGAMATDWFSNK